MHPLATSPAATCALELEPAPERAAPRRRGRQRRQQQEPHRHGCAARRRGRRPGEHICDSRRKAAHERKILDHRYQQWVLHQRYHRHDVLHVHQHQFKQFEFEFEQLGPGASAAWSALRRWWANCGAGCAAGKGGTRIEGFSLAILEVLSRFCTGFSFVLFPILLCLSMVLPA